MMKDKDAHIVTLEHELNLYRELNKELRQRILDLTHQEREKGMLFEALFDHAPFGIAVFDDKRSLLRLNTAAEEIFGEHRHKLVGHSCDELMNCFQNRHTCPGFIEDEAIRGQRTPCENNEKVLLRSVIQVKEGDASLLFETFVDVTAIEEAHIAEAMALQSKSDFLSRITHELRTPMNAIMGYTDLLQSFIDDEAERENSIKGIREGSQRMMSLIEQLLSLEESENRSLRLEKHDTDLCAMLDDLQQEYQSMAMEQGNMLQFDCDPACAQIVTDKRRLSQMLANLVSNAVRFTSNGIVHIRAEHDDDTNSLYVRVTDTGQGIDENKQQKVFEVFEQADTSWSREFEGVGLGLSLAKRYAQLMGGDITLESLAGKGSVFTLRLPLD